MKAPTLALLVLLLLAMIFQPGCKSESEKDPLAEFLKAEARRFEQDPETVGFEYLDDAYQQLSFLQEYNHIWALAELSSDEAVEVPTGLDWDNQGVWKEINQHTWGPGHLAILEVWSALMAGQSAILEARQVFTLAEHSPEVDAIIAEMESLQSLFNYYLIDLFGQAPARDEAGDPVVYTREVAFNRTLAQLTAVLDELPEKSRFSDSRALFRMNKGAAKALLARLYLNQKEYTGNGANETEAMNTAVQLCDEILNSGQYALEPDYWDNFRVDNWMNTAPSNELILTAWNGPEGGFTNTFATLALNAVHFENGGGWNGFATLADFYNKWDPDDPRFLGPRIDAVNAYYGFNEGYQFDANGDTLRLPNGSPLQYIPEVNFQEDNPAAGVRPLKYEPDNISVNLFRGSANLYAIIRLAEVYLMKAEAQFRLGQPSEARATLNTLREARGATPLLSISEDDLLNEYGYELWWEGQRRTHLIRFGRFNDPISIRPVGSGPYRKLFPIPQEALDANPLLKQNGGY